MKLFKHFKHRHRRNDLLTPTPPTPGVERTRMALVDDLRKVAAVLDPSLQVGSNELQPLFSAFLALQDHGDELLKAADEGAAAVSHLLSPPAEPPSADAPTATSGASADELNELRAQVQSLSAQLATSQQTQVVHETGDGPTE